MEPRNRDDPRLGLILLVVFLYLLVLVMVVCNPGRASSQDKAQNSRGAPTVKCELVEQHDALGGWIAQGTIRWGSEVLFDKLLPLARPATDDEAWKACKRFRQKQAPRILKEHGWERPKSETAKKKG